MCVITVEDLARIFKQSTDFALKIFLCCSELNPAKSSFYVDFMRRCSAFSIMKESHDTSSPTT